MAPAGNEGAARGRAPGGAMEEPRVRRPAADAAVVVVAVVGAGARFHNPIAADPELLHRALSNLILNAIEAMPNGGTLTLRAAHHQHSVRIELADTGSGLASEETAQLFTPYYTSKPHGTGLGLVIVQSIVSDHGGRITVASEPGRGTTFIIELPANLDKLPVVHGTHV